MKEVEETAKLLRIRIVRMLGIRQFRMCEQTLDVSGQGQRQIEMNRLLRESTGVAVQEIGQQEAGRGSRVGNRDRRAELHLISGEQRCC